MKFLSIDGLASKEMANRPLLSPAAVFSQESPCMKSFGPQNNNPSYSNNFKFNRVGNMVDLNVVDGLIIGLIIIFIIVGACLLAPAYFTTHFVLNLIKSAKSTPASNTLNQAENQDLNGRLEVL